jgi:hypothetical protein
VETTEVTDQDRRPWWLRLRAVAGLTVMVVALGVLAAVALCACALALTTLLDRALG